MPDQCITLQHIELRLVEEKRKVQEDKGVILRCQWDCIKTKGKERASGRRSQLAVPWSSHQHAALQKLRTIKGKKERSRTLQSVLETP